jgi:hypothetical protein
MVRGGTTEGDEVVRGLTGAVKVAEFFKALVGGKDVEVVITREPEGRLGELL